MTPAAFQEELATLLAKAPATVPDEVLRALEQANDWLQDGPREHCDGYHDNGSC